MQLESYCGDYYIIQRGISFMFGTPDSASEFFTSIMAKEQFYKDGFNCFVSGTNMGFDGFMLKAQNKGIYCNDIDMYDQFITPDVIKGMGVNYIECSGDRDMGFEFAYKQALSMKDKLEQAFGTTVDVFVYNDQSFTLAKKFLMTEARYCKPYEEQFMMGKIEYGLKKNVKQGKEQSIKMQNSILVSMGKA